MSRPWAARYNARAALVTPAAASWLEGAGESRVLHAFDRVVNLVDGERRVLSLHQPGIEMSPFAALIEAAPAEPPLPRFTEIVEADSKVEVGSGRLVVGTLAVRFDGARAWKPWPHWEGCEAASLRAGGELIARALPAAAPPGSLAPLAASGHPAGDELSAFVVSIDLLLRGLAAGDEREVALAAGQLAGRGGGLTPAGDDFLVGTLLALWATGQVAMTGAIVAAAVPRTGALSAAYISAAGRGEAAESWHRLAAALGNGDAARIHAVVRQMARFGHTSGADALTGFVKVLGAGEAHA